MITFLEGILIERKPEQVVLNVGGVGYQVFIPLSTYDKLPSEGAGLRLLTWLCIREDAHTLYGFCSTAERDLFHLLMSVNGVGPKLALAVLNGLSVRDFKAAVVEGNVKRLSSISGIGKKTAERMIVELKDKIPAGEALEAITGAAALGPEDVKLRDAILALVSLGYKQMDALKLVRDVAGKLGPSAKVEDLIRQALAKN